MKPHQFLILFLISTLSSFAQVEPEAVNFLERIIRKTQPEGQIIYTDKINKSVVDKIKSELNKRIISGVTPETKSNFIELTKLEKKSLLSQFETYTNPYWTENLFSNSKLIPEENLTTYIKKAYQEYSENLNNPTSSTNDKLALIKNYQSPNVFEFTMPIYLREKTISVVYVSYRCGNPCGYDELSFYKMENNAWQKWIVVKTEIY